MTDVGTLRNADANRERFGDVRVPPRSAPTGGMTLLEMLVVLALVALLGTLITQGLGFFRYDTVQRVARDAGQAGLQQHWFASSVEGMVPYRQLERQFAGDAATFAGITTQPLAAESGMPVRARWTIEDDGVTSHVLYREDAAPTNDGPSTWTVLRTPDAVTFQYAGADGTWLDAWPAREVGERIPRMVRLVGPSGVIWLARLDLFPEPVTNYSEF